MPLPHPSVRLVTGVVALVMYLLVTGIGAAAGANATIGLNFTGADERQASDFVPDTMGSVGPKQIVEMLNGVYTVYDKTSGQLLQRTSLTEFWSAIGQDGTVDPRVVYDPTVDRWFAVTLGSGGTAIAVSNSGDPTFAAGDPNRGWKGFFLNHDPGDPSNKRWADFPTLGVNADSVTTTWQLIPDLGTGVKAGLEIVSIPKADLISTKPTVANRTMINVDSAVDIIGVAKALQPVLDFGPSRDNSPLFAVHPRAGLWRWDVANVAAQTPDAARIQGPTEIPIGDYGIAPPGRQPDGASSIYNSGGPYVNEYLGRLEHGNTFRSNLVRQGNSVWGVHVVEANGRSGVRWYEIDATVNQVIQSGTIADPALDLIYPSIAVNSLGDAVVGFTATGENKYPSAYAAVGSTVGGVTTFGDLLELKPGQGTFSKVQSDSRNRWGDYSTTVVDPSDPHSFWTFQEFTRAKDQWAVQVTQIRLPGATPRPDLIAVGPAAGYLVRDDAIEGVVDGHGDTASIVSTGRQGLTTIGELDSRLDRFVTKFELPDRPDASERLRTATLRIFLDRIVGIPDGSLSLLHSVPDNRLSPLKSDYEDISYSDTLLDILQPTDTAGRYYEVDVTDLVRADYRQDGIHALSAFRLQIDQKSVLGDGLSNYFRVKSAGTGRPELLLHFVPEPPSSILAIGALLGALGSRTRRTCWSF